MAKSKKADEKTKEIAQLREALRIKNNQLEGLDTILGHRRKEIKSLMLQLEGQKQVTKILEAYILEAVNREGSIEIPKKAVSECLKCGIITECKDDVLIIRKRGADNNG